MPCSENMSHRESSVYEIINAMTQDSSVNA